MGGNSAAAVGKVETRKYIQDPYIGAGSVLFPIDPKRYSFACADFERPNIRLFFKKDDTGYVSVQGAAVFNSATDVSDIAFEALRVGIKVADIMPLFSSPKCTTRINGREFTVSDKSEFPKSVTISDGKSKIVLENQKSISLEGSDGNIHNWKVAICDAWDVRNVFGSGAMSQVWLVADGKNNEMTNGETQPLPKFFGGGAVKYEGLVNDQKMDLSVKCLAEENYRYYDQNKSQLQKLALVELALPQKIGVFEVESGGKAQDFDRVLSNPQTGQTFFKNAGEDFCRLGALKGIHVAGKDMAQKGLAWKFNYLPGETYASGVQGSLTFREYVKLSSDPVQADYRERENEITMPVFKSANGPFSLKKEGSQTSTVWYKGDTSTKDSPILFETPFVTERGTRINLNSTTSAVLSLNIGDPVANSPTAKAKLSVVGVGGLGTPKLLEQKDSLKCYPTPFNDHLTMEFSLQKEARVGIKIYNAAGVEVWHVTDETHLATESEKITVTGLGGLKPGLYTVRMEVEGQPPLTAKVIRR